MILVHVGPKGNSSTYNRCSWSAVSWTVGRLHRPDCASQEEVAALVEVVVAAVEETLLKSTTAMLLTRWGTDYAENSLQAELVCRSNANLIPYEGE